ncbi:MAG: M20/M25/M40 family metallo-hydrolase [Gemmatimonadetes bacterium]|jgi:tripeptide aminopeptidase|nr:M20/M25/M40 family metallo-hydrolase [Gemmatimonadota bacterium]MBK7834003.1 M20/M25/M40 family metallo-hydrolase [Gemmatimonadota bacterium]MBK8648273.1 M20/M25/M40 family metallo-hydrolase [Gemmatimonadota bacterium]MBK9411219.1 M20/M25/M40 family metallo-hydrolase [Gemmatimonadota bacterium]HPV73891.1 M20/M25/M40 family metallo-hydrolase [Gemmatimonadaceae bacterium]
MSSSHAPAARGRGARAALILAALAPLSLVAQQPATVPADHPAVKAALAAIQRDNAWTLEQQVSICEIPAPPFKEEKRGLEMKRRFEALGLPVAIDSIGNVIATRKGTGNGPTVAIAGHLDTVFPEGTNVAVKKEGTKMTAPGIGDDCRGLATILAVARAMQDAKIQTPGTILFIANVGEEGPGNLRGMRYLFRKPPQKIDYFISVDGTGLGLTTGGVGSHRYLIQYTGPGGHSYGAFGMANPIHAMGRAIAKISEFRVPKEPKTTFNVGIVSGGTSVNTISPLGAMEVDMRSESPVELAKVDAKFKTALAEALREENARWPGARDTVSLKITDMGVRPAAQVNDTSFIARTALTAGKSLGFTAPTGASSTDSNIPMSLGIPAITIDGGGEGKGAHSITESYDDGKEGFKGPQWALLIVSALTGLGRATYTP